jgi:hypothetical protein
VRRRTSGKQAGHPGTRGHRDRPLAGHDRSRPRPERRTHRPDLIEGDFLGQPFDENDIDLVSFVASMHHMDFTAAPTKAVSLPRPSGRLVVVGLARTVTPIDWLISGLCLPLTRLSNLRRDRSGPTGMLVADPTLSWRQVKQQACDLLPGVRHRHHLLYRYSLRWTKPSPSADEHKSPKPRPRFDVIPAVLRWSERSRQWPEPPPTRHPTSPWPGWRCDAPGRRRRRRPDQADWPGAQPLRRRRSR